MSQLSTATTSLWAKKEVVNDELLWLPLITHLKDTQNVMIWLFQNWLSEGQRQFLIEGNSAENIQKLVKFLGFVHDLGKSSPVFDEKSFGNVLLDTQMMNKLVESGFKGFTAGNFLFGSKSPHALAGEALLVSEYGVPKSIAAIVGGHHGKPLETDPSNQILRYAENYFQNAKDSKIQHPWRQAQNELFNYALESSGYHSKTELPEVQQPQAILLEGLLIMSDWLASSEYMDKEKKRVLFPLIPLNQGWQDVSTDKRCEVAMGNWAKAFNNWIPKEVTTSDRPYQERWQFKPRFTQKKMTKAISNIKDPGIIIAEAPMGTGKTEMALLAVEQLAAVTKRNGLFVGLPTQATTNAMYNRVEKWVEFLAKKQGTDFSIKLAHSKAKLNQNYLDLPDASGVDNFDAHGWLDKQAGTVVVNSWFSGKKGILTQFTIGTIDQLLMMALKQKHLFLRHLAFSGKVVVIDEAHASDTYMNQFLFKALNWLGTYHVPVIVLSATLPRETRNNLLGAYYHGKFGQSIEHGEEQTKWQNTDSYPLLSILDGKKIEQITDFNDAIRKKTVTVKIHRLKKTDQEIIDSVVNKIKNGGIAGVIVDTVKEAQKLSYLIPDDIPHLVFHSAFLAGERANKEQVLQDEIGKNGHRPFKMIVIGTQVLEQSLDIDFDVLYTDIAPMDLLLQRIGRLHRHNIDRPTELRVPEAFIMGIEAYGKYREGISFVYEPYLLMKTDYYLKDDLILPTNISPLVQAVYDPQQDNQIPAIHEAQKRFEAHMEKKKADAKAFQIRVPKHNFKPIHGWLKHAYDPSDSSQQSGAAVRDIQDTLEVILLKQINGTYFSLAGRKVETLTDKEIAEQTIRLPVNVTRNMGQIVSDLQNDTHNRFPNWGNSKWLRGSYAVVLDSKQSTTLSGWQLKYSSEWGLSYKKEE